MLAYFDCTNGVAGDMIVASLIDAGACWDSVSAGLAKLNLPGYRLNLAEVRRGGIRAKQFQVIMDHHEHHHRNLADITTLIQNAPLSDIVKHRAVRIFTRLAHAEASVHQCTINEVHFHEVGAVDAIVDIVGSCIAMDLLNINQFYYSKIAVGSGYIKAAHGTLPVPAPATSKLLEGSTIESGGREGELATPTGAAVLTTLGSQRTELPEMRLKTVGYGAGSRDIPDHPNILRVFLAEEADASHAQTDEVAVLTFSLDNITGEHLGFLAERLLAAGALDVVQFPIYMKKGRSATSVEVLAEPCNVDSLVELILTQGTTFGLRVGRQQRFKLARDMIAVILPEGKIRVKLGYLGQKLVQINPEFEDCRKASDRTGTNFRQIWARAAEQARVQLETEAR